MSVCKNQLSECNIIPIVKSFEKESREIKIDCAIKAEYDGFGKAAEVFSDAAERIFGANIIPGEGGIYLIYDESIEEEEYKIIIDENVVVKASGVQGISYALASVLQLVKYKDGAMYFDKCRISDKPDKDYRGLMVDLARNWHPFDCLLKFVDICYFYKIKYLHLHFVDNEGYTLPSKAFPKLAKEGESYTFDEIAQLCEYAKERGIELIPEMEMPGHIYTLNEAYPEIFANTPDEGADSSIVTENGAVLGGESVLCAGSQKAFEGIIKLIDEVLDMFGCKYIHLGSDEVNTSAWDNCSVCREYMKKNSIKNAEELYCDFTRRVTEYVLAKGVTPIIWEGFGEEYSHMISKDVVVIGWESYYQNPEKLFKSGYKLINCSWQPLYIVPSVTERWGIKEILDWNVYNWQHWWEKSEATLNPITLPESEQIWGAQICVWEQPYERGINFLAENLAALTERVWSHRRYRTFAGFLEAYRFQSAKVFKLIARK